MARQAIPINGSVLRWAREEGGLSETELADAVRVNVTDVTAWENGEASPSRGSFSKVVEVLKRPSAVFFLPQPQPGGDRSTMAGNSYTRTSVADGSPCGPRSGPSWSSGC